MAMFDIVAQRLHNQQLVGSSFARPDQVVHWLGAVQSQEYPGATWAIAQRTYGLNQAALDQAFAAGTILRTHAMRPTWHFVAPADLRWLLSLTLPRVHALNGSYYRKLELDAPTLVRGAEVLTSALVGDKQLTREELAFVLQQAGILRTTEERMRLVYVMMYAELEGLICSGAMRGKQHTYALLDQRVPPGPLLTRDEALAELVLRYFRSHGPATIKDFTWWSGLTVADAKVGLELNKSRLELAVIDQTSYWFAPNPAARLPDAPIAHLLPAYDEYTVAYKNHEAIIQHAYLQQIIAAFGTVIVIDGRIVGTWKRVLTKNTVLLTLRPFVQLNEAHQQALDAAIERYAAFLQRAVVLMDADI